MYKGPRNIKENHTNSFRHYKQENRKTYPTTSRIKRLQKPIATSYFAKEKPLLNSDFQGLLCIDFEDAI